MAAYRKLANAVLVVGGALLCGCTARSVASAVPVQQELQSILVSSNPAAASTVAGPLNELILHFDPPSRLDEVTVNGPDGLMPMMVTAASESSRYSLPLSELGPGSYEVNWRATSRGTVHRGSFSFTVK